MSDRSLREFEGKWVYSADEETGWGGYGKEYETREDAVQAANGDVELPPGSEFFTGQVRKPELPCIDGEEILDVMAGRMDEKYEDLAEDFLDEKDLLSRKADVDKLGKALTLVFHNWLVANKLLPTFTVVEAIEKAQKSL